MKITKEFLEKTGYKAIRVHMSSGKELILKDLSIESILHFQEQVDNYPKQTSFWFPPFTIFPGKIDFWQVGLTKMAES